MDKRSADLGSVQALNSTKEEERAGTEPVLPGRQGWMLLLLGMVVLLGLLLLLVLVVCSCGPFGQGDSCE